MFQDPDDAHNAAVAVGCIAQAVVLLVLLLCGLVAKTVILG